MTSSATDSNCVSSIPSSASILRCRVFITGELFSVQRRVKPRTHRRVSKETYCYFSVSACMVGELRHRYVGDTTNRCGFALDWFFGTFEPFLALLVANAGGEQNSNEFAIAS
jgi:hypothetical protein